MLALPPADRRGAPIAAARWPAWRMSCATWRRCSSCATRATWASSAEQRGGGQPTLYIYDRAPAGLGFSQALFELETGVLLRGAAEVCARAAAPAAVPACVGPAGEWSGDVKGQVVRLVDAVLAGG